MAKDVSLIIRANSRDAEQSLRDLQRTGNNVTSLLERDFDQLGTKSAAIFDRQREVANAAYERIKKSGVATADELTRAERARAEAVARIDEEQFGKRNTAVEMFKQNWIAAAAAISAALVGVNAAIDMAQESAKYEAQATAFANLAASHGQSADKIVTDMQKAGNETISMSKTVEMAGKAMVLGVSGEYLPQLMEIARTTARITGQTTEEAFNNLVEGVAKGSKELLDNNGIVIRLEESYKKYAAAHGLVASKLNDEQKRQAVLNDVLEKGNDIVERAGKTATTEAEKFQQFSASMEDVKLSIGSLLSGPMAELASEVKATVSWLDAYKSGNISFWEWMTTGADEAAEKLKNINQTGLDALVSPEAAAEAARKNAEAARQSAEASLQVWTKSFDEMTKKHAEAMDVMARQQKEFVDLQRFGEDLEQSLAQKFNPSDAISPYDQFYRDLGRIDADAVSAMELSGQKKADALKEVMDRLKDLPKEVRDGDKVVISSMEIYEEAMTRFREYREEAEAAKASEVEAAGARAAQLAEEVAKAQEQMGKFHEQIVELDAKISELSRDVVLSLDDQASDKVAKIKQDLDSIKDKTVTVRVNYLTTAPAGVPASASPVAAPSSGSYAIGTNYVPRTGLYQLHRGEQVVTRGDAGKGQGGTVTIAPSINISMQGQSSDPERTARDLARQIEPELRRLAARYR